MADAVVFPSKTEGRVLPIIEASASGTPIICSQYRPKEVFRDVIGEKLPEELRIRYTRFPGGNFPPEFLSEVADLLINIENKQKVGSHNKEVVRARYSTTSLKNKFERLLKHLCELE
jgi:glycosyltransferase involved in cell wall biosynthesis